MKVGLRDIEWAVCMKFNLTRDDLRGVKRARRYVRPRQIMMYLARQHTNLSYPQIGMYMCRDHTTVLHGERRIIELLASKPKLAAHVAEIRVALFPAAATRAENAHEVMEKAA